MKQKPDLSGKSPSTPDDDGSMIERALQQEFGENGSPPPSFPLPDQIGPYKIIRRIGEGGMGVVYEAEQAEPTRRVALKVIRSVHATDHARLFKREIQILARLRHASIARIYDAGQTEDQQYFAMELIQGEPLLDYCESAELSLKNRLALLPLVSEAVQYAHQRGVIHRDLKPANILVDEGGMPHVLDFGLAQVIDPNAQITRSLMEGRTLIGTLPYMSPEQIQGDVTGIDVRTDVYSLGVILYQMITLQYPYDVSGGLIAALKTITETDPKRPSEFRGHFDDDLDTIALKALAKEPDHRYQSVEALARDIEHYHFGRPIDAKRDSTWYVFTKSLKRHRVAVGVASMATVLLVVSLIAIAITARERGQRLAESHANTVAIALQRGNWCAVLSASQESISAGYEDPAELHLARVEAFVALNNGQQAMKELASASNLATTSQKARILLWRGDLGLHGSLDKPNAITLVKRAIELGLPPADRSFAEGLIASTSAEALKRFEAAVSADPYRHRASILLGIAYMTQGQFKRAEEFIRHTLRIYPDDLEARFFLAILLVCNGENTEAIGIVRSMEPQFGKNETKQLLVFLGIMGQLIPADKWKNGSIPQNPTMVLLPQLIPVLLSLSSSRGDVSSDLSEGSPFTGLAFPPWFHREVIAWGPIGYNWFKGDINAALKAASDIPIAVPDLHIAKGLLLKSVGRLREAEASLQAATESPTLIGLDSFALFEACQIQWHLARELPEHPDLVMHDRALQSLQKLAESGHLGPKFAAAALAIAIEAREFDTARWIVQNWELDFPDDGDAKRSGIEVEFQAGAYEVAIRRADAFLAKHPNDTKVRGYQELADSELRQACRSLTSASNVNGN